MTRNAPKQKKIVKKDNIPWPGSSSPWPRPWPSPSWPWSRPSLSWWWPWPFSPEISNF